MSSKYLNLRLQFEWGIIFSSGNYLQIWNRALNKSKFSIHPLFTQLELLTFCIDKIEFLDCKYFSNSTLDLSLPDVPFRNALILKTMHVSLPRVSAIIYKRGHLKQVDFMVALQ